MFRPIVSKIAFSRPFSQSSRLAVTSLTFFTKETCQLCTNAKTILYDTLKDESLNDKSIKLDVIDIMKPENSKWFDVYCYDVPVIHIDRPNQKKPVKFMHYFHHDKLLEEFQK
ncbi:uncharacterized protein CANTADRAFT_23860 [Suhomyces tanzawaensis NRRL Y-17324]|uniref:Glutaredoxin-like protein n=1 Tax=Suhomyces tanzawaensis NRRL Y-17324 TaxID=984487 RepID=A0A1E4SBZ3_9ASCO|nr:uncharacterized protein CANTADRAFT_23860 [Suhomyces tanzawaensis NRRL Y-17324]ODV77023.1 hypothetical protein CANTADRAFT_23860 [Suhomyces tanzawaensis NRRL Y-17324]